VAASWTWHDVAALGIPTVLLVLAVSIAVVRGRTGRRYNWMTFFACLGIPLAIAFAMLSVLSAWFHWKDSDDFTEAQIRAAISVNEIPAHDHTIVELVYASGAEARIVRRDFDPPIIVAVQWGTGFAIVAATIAVFVRSFVGGRVRVRRRRRDECIACGYSLLGASGHVCPECGEASRESLAGAFWFHGGDIDWWDRNVKARMLSDADVVKAAAKVNPHSTALVELFREARWRGLREILPVARRHLDPSDVDVAIAAAFAVRDFGDASDVPRLISMVDRWDYDRVRAAVLDAIVTLDPGKAEYALEVAGRRHDDDEFFDDDYVMASVLSRLAEVLPDDSPDLEGQLLAWAADSRLTPTQLESVYRRLAVLPRTPRVEEFFVDFCVRDDGANRELTRIVDEALREKD
jgi:hypothetical protein